MQQMTMKKQLKMTLSVYLIKPCWPTQFLIQLKLGKATEKKLYHHYHILASLYHPYAIVM